MFIAHVNYDTSTKEPGCFGRLGGAGGTPPPPIPNFRSAIIHCNLQKATHPCPLRDAHQNRHHAHSQVVVSVLNGPVFPLPSSLRRVSPTIVHLFQTRARQDHPAPVQGRTTNRLSRVLGCGVIEDEPLSGRPSISAGSQLRSTCDVPVVKT